MMKRLFKNKGQQSPAIEIKKTKHKKHILHALYFNGSLSNSEIAKIVKLSTPKINSLLVELINDKLVEDLGRGDSSGGRRPNIYGLLEDGFYVVGITININRTIISIFNSKNQEVSGPHFFPIKMQSDISIFRKVNQELEKVLTESKIPLEKIIVAGIEIPGLINQKLGVNKTYFPEVENLFQELKKIFGIPVYFDHDSKVRTFAEQHFGLAKNKKHVLMLQADWGLGLGIITDGKLYTGKSGFSGEFGHLPLADNGVLCNCGKHGCLETIVSANAIALKAKDGIKNGNSSLIQKLVDSDLEKIDITVVLQAANLGDQFAISLFAEAGKWLGRGIAFLLQIFNPEIIIIGGRVAEAQKYIIAPIQQAVQTYASSDISSDTEILFSELGSKAGTVGAAAYALNKITFLK